MIRCWVCGRFMSDDDVDLGFCRDVETPTGMTQEYAHDACIPEGGL